MKKYLIVDERMRGFEKEALKNLGYELIELKKDKRVYEEISAHTDIFLNKIGNNIICEPKKYEEFPESIKKYLIKGKDEVGSKYPEDIKYNVCNIGKKVIHNFKYTDSKIMKIAKEKDFEIINCNQGYANCSIAVINENSVITSDKGIYEKIKNLNIDALYLDYLPDIKLLVQDGYSQKNGFIGGAIAKVFNNIIVFGDLEKIDKDKKIREFIEKRNLKIIEFKGEDVIDYGGILEI
jgi:hypothetical protein